MIVFRPFKGEVLFGKISNASEEGLQSKSLNFFSFNIRLEKKN